MTASFHPDGSPLRFTHPDLPGHPFLLQEGADRWHTPAHRWGSGFAITSRGSGRWNAASGTHEPVPGLTLTIARTTGETALTETYTWLNTGDSPLTLGSLAVSLPIRDVYDDAEDALTRACHAHVWTGGAWSWVLAQPMSGEGPVLGTIVREGALWAYSVESRNIGSGSNVRGHILLHVTDHARNPQAFGGQPEIVLEPGRAYVLRLETGFHDTVEAFLAATRPPVAIDRLVAETGRTLRVGDREITSHEHGALHVELPGGSRTAVLFHLPRRELVERRVARVLADHRPLHLDAPERHAFVPYDNATGLTQPTNGWGDWTDGAERLAMPTLLQQARLRGWGDAAAIDEALHGWSAFARAWLVEEDGTVRRGSHFPEREPRLYNFPWLAHFFADQFKLYGEAADLDLAARIVERAYTLGAIDHLLLGFPEVILQVAGQLDENDQPARAAGLRDSLAKHAAHFARLGHALPSHEVNYEQSMVAPLVSLLAADGDHPEALERALRWLRAFGGPQPHVRLRDIGIRHWDGFWFGRDRLYGDVFPHYWSVLTAVALSQVGEKERAEAIFRANLVNYTADASATCAFVMPSCVEGLPAHRPDPLANDQDWALTLWLRSTHEE
ncbi:hypothetical protein ACFWY5_19915 [Nonomuraea sp. NPDC059007]|uniref:hypothetical protein n=1 Tax=Nonomuraea sp. NPDC059007 TaxID=3346692 RepID=UPI0036C5A378